MAMKKTEKDATKIKNKAVNEIMTKPAKKKSGKIQRLVHINKVEARKSDGWVEVKKHENKKELGGTDLVLMEKEI